MWSSIRPPTRLLLASLLLLARASSEPAKAYGQTHYHADPRESLAWWQLNPHLNHLWATTCQADPAWRPGEGVSISQAASYVRSMQKRFGYAAIMDTIIPLYPRRRVRAVCAPAVIADIQVDDTVRWQGVHGRVAITAEAINTGLNMRDNFLHGLIETSKYPEVTFDIDSLVSVQPGDTLKAIAVGTLTFHGVPKSMRVPLRAWHELNGLRVMGQVKESAMDLTEVYHLSKVKLGLGVGLNLWKELHMGLDIVLIKPPGGSSSQ